jgi:hypothetical protein
MEMAESYGRLPKGACDACDRHQAPLCTTAGRFCWAARA